MSASPPASFGPDRVIAGKFRLVKRLGQGGMGSVWAADHLVLNSQVAVKIIDSSIAQNQEALARFLREAQAAAQLRSPHVVQTLDYGVEDSVPFIAMELLEGESLAHRLDRLHRLTLPETAKILTEVGRAISKAHETGIVHRDLKPDNIFLVKNDDDEIAKVLDFGIAKATNPALGSSSQTRTGAILGTPYYMSPEQAEGNRSIDHRTDLWSLAVIAFECVTGRKPFQSEALGDLILQICVKPIKKPSSFEAVPPAFDDWFAKATQRDPARRFQSARELSTALRVAAGLQAGEAVRVPSDNPRPQSGPPPGESNSGRSLNATTGGMGAVAHTSYRPPTTQMSKPVIVSATLGALTLAGTVGFFALRAAGHGEASSTPSASANVASASPGKPTAEAPATEIAKPAEPPASVAAPAPEPPPAQKAEAVAPAAVPTSAHMHGKVTAAHAPAKPAEKTGSTSKKVDFGF